MICKVTVLTHLSCPGPCRGAWHTSGGGAGVEGGEAAGLGPALLCQQQLQLAGLSVCKKVRCSSVMSARSASLGSITTFFRFSKGSASSWLYSWLMAQ